jgi:TPR repeat protein
MGRIIDELSHNSPKVSEKLSEAKSWFEKAANQGHRESMYYMGYILGEKEKRSAEAIPWFERACALQYAEAGRLASFHRKKLGG